MKRQKNINPINLWVVAGGFFTDEQLAIKTPQEIQKYLPLYKKALNDLLLSSILFQRNSSAEKSYFLQRSSNFVAVIVFGSTGVLFGG